MNDPTDNTLSPRHPARRFAVLIGIALMAGACGPTASQDPSTGAPRASFNQDFTSGGPGLKVQFTDTSRGDVDTYAWDFDGLGSSEEKEPSFRFDEGEHEVRVSLFNKQCVKQLIFPFNIEKLFIPNVSTPNGDGKNDTFEIRSFWPVRVSIFSRYGKNVFSS